MSLSLPLRSRPGSRRPPATFIGAALLAELILAASIVSHRLAPLLLLFAGVAVWGFMVRWPLFGMSLLILLAATFLPTDYLQVQAGPLHLDYHELVLIGMLASAALFPRYRTWGGVAGACLAGFFALLGLATAIAVSSGRVDLSDAWQWSRPFAPLLVFYIVVRLFGERVALRRLIAAAAIAAGASGGVALLIALGVNLTSILGDASMYYVNQNLGIGSLARIRLPAIALAYPLFWYVALRIPATRGMAKLGWSLVLAGIVVNLAVSLNRNMWAGILVGLVGLVIVGGVRVRRPLVVAVAAMAGAIALIAIVGLQVDRGPLQPFVERGETLLSPKKTEQENSLQDRGKETEKAWSTFKGSPVTGIGAGTAFGVYFDEQQSTGIYKRTRQLFLHNQYLYLLLICGIPGAVAFLGFMTAAVNRGRRALDDPEIATWTIDVGMIALSAFVMISFADAPSALALGLITGAIVAATSTSRTRVESTS
jgi:O-antigen ligase